MATQTTIRFDVVDRDGRVITDDDEAQEALDDQRATWRRTCASDGTDVDIRHVGTSEYAACQRGHRWQYNFNHQDGAGWILIGQEGA